ncbi:ATPase [Nanoarchaeota archaeon]
MEMYSTIFIYTYGILFHMGMLKEITYEYIDSLRYVKNKIKRNIDIPETTDIVSIIGPRRVGKTFLMLNKAKELLDNEKQVIYISFDEPMLLNIDVRKFAELVRSEYPKDKVYLFLDEIQEWKNWDYNLRWLHDVKDFYIFISGSSSTLQSSEIPSKLRGRYISELILPISFREIINFEIKTFREKGKVLNLLENYIKWGGFPEIWIQKSREKIISILESVFYRDIIERYKIKDIEIFKEIFYYILSNFSNRFTYNSIKDTVENLGIKIDTKTIIRYISYMRNSFLIFIIEPFYYSERKKIISPKKIYNIDVSFTNLFEQGINLGRKVENLVFIELLRKYKNIYYYITKSGKEIDFYVLDKKILIEVSLENNEEDIKKLKEAMNELKINNGYIITWDYEDEIDLGNKKIKYIPLWKFLLLEHF